jgi:AcrR family transcriptional regulator
MDGPRQRILEATYACVARWGLAKTTVEDAAREAGLSRATVYRYFPGGRDELIDAVVSWQYVLFFVQLYEEVHGATSLEEVLDRGLAFARRSLQEHEVLQTMLATEPQVLMPKLTVESNRTVGLIAGFLIPYLHEHGMAQGVDVHEAADFLARMILSYIASPGHWDLGDPEQVATLVRTELLAGVVAQPRLSGP